MNDLAFPVLGAAFVFFVAVPGATLLVKAMLVLQRRHLGRLPALGSTTTWLLLVAPVAVPAAWFISAAVHQSKGGSALAACLQD